MLVLGQLLDDSQALFALDHVPGVPCALLTAIVQAFLATKSFAAGSSMFLYQLACVSKSVPRDVISLIGCCPQLPKSAVGVMHISWG